MSEDWGSVRTARVNGAPVRVSTSGSGDPILLLMGIGAGLDVWQPFAEQLLTRGYQVISFDLPGTGESPALFPPKRMRGLARLAVGVLDELGIEQAHVVGISFGGLVAQEIARRSPDRVRSLVLAATGPGLGGPPGKTSALVHLLTPSRHLSAAYATRVAGSLYGGRARLDPARYGVLIGSGRPPTWVGYLGQLYAVTGWSSIPWLHQLRSRTLVMNGDDDPIVRTLNGRIMAALIPDARLEIIRGGGHLFLLDQSRQAADLAHAFLDGGA
jgi:pimeloyl-ACP methyl ester carboxylesterase